jgi:hypothetical protein
MIYASPNRAISDVELARIVNDPKIEAFLNAGLIERPRPKPEKESNLEAILNEILAIVKDVQAKVNSGGGRSGGGSRKKREVKVKPGTEQNRVLAVKKVWVDKYAKGTKYNIETEGGPKIGTWDEDFGALAQKFEGTGTPLQFVFGENDRGYIDAVKVAEADVPF